MKFSDYLNQAWKEHGDQPQKVADNYNTGISLMTEETEIASMAQLVLHVSMEHLSSPKQAKTAIRSLKDLTVYDENGKSGQSLKRSDAIIDCLESGNEDFSEFSEADQVRIHCLVASLTLGMGQSEKSQSHLEKSLAIYETENDLGEAIKSLAITGNNMACTLEEMNERDATEDSLMELAALTGRQFWEKCGSWVEVERAEYRLAKTYIQLKNSIKAFEHAQNCVAICKENKADDLEMAFAYECLASIEEHKDNEFGKKQAVEMLQKHFSQVSSEDQEWSRPMLGKFIDS